MAFGHSQEAYPIMPIETKHFILPEHVEIQQAADMDEMVNSTNWYRTHTHTHTNTTLEVITLH